MDNFIEKFIDTYKPGATQEINKYMAAGWYIHYNGLTVCILRKNITEV
jgi:hypothetical protein